MENFFATIFSGVAGKLLGHPLDFLAGKSCKIHNHNQQRRKRQLRDIEATLDDEGEVDYKEDIGFKHQSRRFQSRRRHQDKDESLRRALRPRNHPHTRVRIDPYYLHKKKHIRVGDHIRSSDHVIRVGRSSKFSRKRPSFKASMHHRRRRK